MNGNTNIAFGLEMENGNRMKINLIDDEQIVIKLLSGFLGDLGHEVTSFCSVEDFVCKSNGYQTPPDVIIVNLTMSRKENTESLKNIHQAYPKTDIVVMSTVLPMEEAVAGGVYSYLERPISLSKLELLLLRIDQHRRADRPSVN